MESIVEGAVNILRQIGTWWMSAPGPYFDNPIVQNMRDNLSWFVWFFGVVGFLLALGRLVVTAYTSGSIRDGLVSIGALFLNIVLATGVYIALIPMLLNAGDAVATWLLDQSTDNADFATLAQPMAAEAFLASPGTAFLLALCLFIGAIANFLMLLLRNVLLLVLIVFLPVIAAGSNTEAGRQSWRKANAYLIACLLMKPLTAAIYGFGFMLLQDSGEDFGQVIASSISGILLLLMAALVLPTLVRFLSPVAATGMSGFSGAGLIGAGVGVAAGAAMIAGAGGAGAAAMAGGASRAGGGSGGASMGGAGGAPTEGTGGTPTGGTDSGGTTAPGVTTSGTDSAATTASGTRPSRMDSGVSSAPGTNRSDNGGGGRADAPGAVASGDGGTDSAPTTAEGGAAAAEGGAAAAGGTAPAEGGAAAAGATAPAGDGGNGPTDAPGYTGPTGATAPTGGAAAAGATAPAGDGGNGPTDAPGYTGPTGAT
ncbi:hypothetical protein ABZ556_10230, partial [Micrococcus luteus]|uniref:hypothetical protein n=1 Tax=Micrococcus luteus TaxID=1270 RepID=UPI003478451C